MALRYYNDPHMAKAAASLAAAFAPPSPAALAQAEYNRTLAAKTQQDVNITRAKREALDELGSVLAGVRQGATSMSAPPADNVGPVLPHNVALERSFEMARPEILSSAVRSETDPKQLGSLLNLAGPATEEDRLTYYLTGGGGPLKAGDYPAFTIPGLEVQQDRRLGDINAQATHQGGVDRATATHQQGLDIQAGYQEPVILGKDQSALLTPEHAAARGDPSAQVLYGSEVGPNAAPVDPNAPADFGSGTKGASLEIVARGVRDPVYAATSPDYALAYHQLYVQPQWQRTTDAMGNVYMQELPPNPVPQGVPEPGPAAVAASVQEPAGAPAAVPGAEAPAAPVAAAPAAPAQPQGVGTDPSTGLRRFEIGQTPPTENLSRGRELYTRAVGGHDTLNEVMDVERKVDPNTGAVGYVSNSRAGGYRPLFGTMTMGTAPGIVGDVLNYMFMTPEGRQFVQGSMSYVNSILRRDSGAAVPETEYPKYFAQFIPRPGDDDDIIELKALSREIALDALRANVGLGETPEQMAMAAEAALAAAVQAVGPLPPSQADLTMAQIYAEEFPLPNERVR